MSVNIFAPLHLANGSVIENRLVKAAASAISMARVRYQLRRRALRRYETWLHARGHEFRTPRVSSQPSPPIGENLLRRLADVASPFRVVEGKR